MSSYQLYFRVMSTRSCLLDPDCFDQALAELLDEWRDKIRRRDGDFSTLL